jgi:rhodanese-related sulfurtransferase
LSRSALLFLLPALVLSASDCVIPEAVEMRTGVFILKGGAAPDIYSALRRQRITHVLDLRKDAEITPASAFQMTVLQEMKVHYMRYATSGVPPKVDIDFIRGLLKDFPKGSRIVVTCNTGNRAAAAVCSWLVLDEGMPVEEAMTASHRAGLRVPETEAAIRGYLTERL